MKRRHGQSTIPQFDGAILELLGEVAAGLIGGGGGKIELLDTGGIGTLLGVTNCKEGKAVLELLYEDGDISLLKILSDRGGSGKNGELLVTVTLLGIGRFATTPLAELSRAAKVLASLA